MCSDVRYDILYVTVLDYSYYPIVKCTTIVRKKLGSDFETLADDLLVVTTP